MDRVIKTQSVAAAASTRCGVILAAGDGTRLRHFVRWLRGEELPKQYVSFFGARSMLEHTFRRVERLIFPERLYTVIARDHLKYAEVRRQIRGRPWRTVIVQPENRDTAPGLLLPLAHIYRRYPDSLVAVFPSDHFIVEEDLFMERVDHAFRVIERFPASIVLLAVAAAEPDPEYGYIVPGAAVGDPHFHGLRWAKRFVEKPDIEAARELVRKGGLWNTLVTVFKVTTFLRLVRDLRPVLYEAFDRILLAIETADERRVTDEVYAKLQALNFSRGILEVLSRDRLLVLPVRGVTWSDWGSTDRLLRDLMRLRAIGHEDIRRWDPEGAVPSLNPQMVLRTQIKRIS